MGFFFSHSGVNPSIEVSTTFTGEIFRPLVLALIGLTIMHDGPSAVLEPSTLTDIFEGQRGPAQGKFHPGSIQLKTLEAGF